jgi:hypothetical protein
LPDHKSGGLAAKTENRFATFGFLDEAHAEFPKNVENRNRNVPHRSRYIKTVFHAQTITRGNCHVT